MGTLYVVGVPEDREDLTFRALDILRAVKLVIANDVLQARHFLSGCGLTTQVSPAVGSAALLSRLGSEDMAILFEAWTAGPDGAAFDLLCLAAEQHRHIVPVPGPVDPITALAISGLPADRFVYLGEMPAQADARRACLCTVASERATLVASVPVGTVNDLLDDLNSVLGHRALALVWASARPEGSVWRGTTREAAALPPASGRRIVVVEGARHGAQPWEERRLRDAVEAELGLGFGVGEVSRKLAAMSGWSRRQIYHLAVEMARRNGCE